MCLTPAPIAPQLPRSSYSVRPELGRYDTVDYVLIERSSRITTIPQYWSGR